MSGAEDRSYRVSDTAAGPEGLGLPGVRVRTLVILRWIAITGQLATLAIIGPGLGFPLAPWPPLAAIAASVGVNIGSTLLYPRTAELNGREATIHLAFDLLQLAVLLFLTGGLNNPFAVLILVPVTISATLLSLRSTIILISIAIACLAALALWALPLPWHGPALALPPLYQAGQGVALLIGMTFLAAYAWRVSAEARRRQQALIATQTALAREQKMSALGSLAAAAAHELGGPLGTITLIARDLDDQLGNDPDFGDDVKLLRQEAARCREILVGIARRAEADQPFPRLPLEALVYEVVKPFEGGRVALTVRQSLLNGAAPVLAARTPELLHGLANIVSNAVRHARAQVDIDIEAGRDEVRLTVRDDGDGFDPALLPRLGEPYLGPSQSRSGGTGLGVFIATTLLERTGGTLTFANVPEGGARVDIRWTRHTLDPEETRA